MNPMLASVLSSTPAAPSRAGANASGCAKGSDGEGEGAFAGCMGKALDAAKVSPVDEPKAETPERAAAEAATNPQEPQEPQEPTAAGTPDLSALLPGWVPPQAHSPAAAATVVAQTTAALDDVTAGPITKTDTPLTAAGNSPARTAKQHSDDAASAARSATPQPAPAALAAPRAEAAADACALPSTTTRLQGQGQAHTPTAETQPAGPALSPITQSTPLASASRAESPVATAHVAAAIETPAFAPSLATQVRWWAQDGVQQAQLTLNPPEMGPVAVRILVLDGREARIDFSADVAATRSAIEAALPVLAAALDDSGLKLSGGGVHDGTAQQRHMPWQTPGGTAHRGDGGRDAASRDSLAIASASTPPRPGPARGLIDLVA
jgi:flagellar hook-length control protein FliK